MSTSDRLTEMPDKPDARAAEARLKAAQDRKRRRQMGKPLALSDSALEQAAEVREADAANAVAYWRQNAPAGFKNLLDAEPEELNA
jgi:hypothetical protein